MYDLLLAALECRFGADLAIGRVATEAAGDDIALSGGDRAC